LFDMKILWLTCLQVIKRDGVSHWIKNEYL